MATFSNLRAVYGLISTGAHSKSRVANDAEVGAPSTSVTIAGTKAYTITATLATVADTLSIDTATGIATIGTTPVPQVETATAVGTITLTGNATVVVTAARVTGSPITLSVPVTNTDNAATWAGKVRAALTANAAIAAVYTVGGASASITLTETSAQNNDATLNISLDNGTCTGITTAATSTNTTAGVGGVKLTNNTGDGKDFEGVSLGTMTAPLAILVKVVAGTIVYSYDGGVCAGAMAGAGAITLLTGIGASGTFLVTADLNSSEVELTFVS